jgi:hypothetical protein
VFENPAPAVEAEEGVGERTKRSFSDGEGAEDDDAKSPKASPRLGVDAEKGWWAGSGVDTPSAFASLAKRCGASRALGVARGGPAVEGVMGVGGGSADDLGVSSSCMANGCFKGRQHSARQPHARHYMYSTISVLTHRDGFQASLSLSKHYFMTSTMAF